MSPNESSLSLETSGLASQGNAPLRPLGEGALTVDDILDRRTRIGLVAADRERAVTAAQEFLAVSG